LDLRIDFDYNYYPNPFYEKMTILENTFFGYWKVFGEYFVFLWAFALILCIVVAVIYLLTKK
jgi:hypothetical protein